MWNALRTAARSWAEGVLNVTSSTSPTETMINAKAQDLIGHVTIQDMNRYVKTAGEYIAAKTRLHELGPNDQISGREVFRAPWATTTDNPAIPERYRIKINWQLQYKGFTTVQRNEWATYELSGSLTNAQDAIDRARSLFSQAKYNRGATIQSVLDYSIEAV